TFTSYRHDPKDPASLASDSVRDVLVDARGRISAGTIDAGIDVLDPTTGRLEHLRHDPSAPASLSNDRILTLALDRAGHVWVGSEGGLDRWQMGQSGFVHFGPAAGEAHSLRGK